ncbi:hypothetical protein D3C80_1639070 [compost metagenome]
MAGICPVVFATEGKEGVFLSAVPAQRVDQVMQHVRVLRPVHDKHAVFGVLLGGTASGLAICLQGARDHRDIVMAVAPRLPGSSGDGRRDAESLALHVQPGVLGGQRGSLADIALEAVSAICWHAS